jgi:DNA-binding Lrp family transcriptional regulator
MFYLSFIFSAFELIVAIKIFTKGLKVKGKLRLKFQMLSIGFIGTITFMYVTFFTQTIEFIYGIMLLGSGFLGWYPLYYGLTPVKAAKAKKKKTPSKSELKLVSYLTDKNTLGEDISIDDNLRDVLVFVSYSTKDSKNYKIQDIAEKLKEYQGIKDVLFYEGESFDNIIKYMNDNLGECDAFLLFCSQNALSSVPVEKEWTAAEALGVPIIPIFFDQKHIPPLLRSRLGVEYDFYNLDQTVRDIYSTIVKKCVEGD